MIEIGQLDEKLKNKINFEFLYSKRRSKEKDSVIIYNKKNRRYENKQIFRSYCSFLKTPKFNPEAEKSYMFLEKQENLPPWLSPFLDFAKNIDKRYNQVVVNWYSDEEYIEPHRDCSFNMLKKNSPILCVNLNEKSAYDRNLLLDHVKNENQYRIKLGNFSYYILKDNINYRHSVGIGTERRISITFRMMK